MKKNSLKNLSDLKTEDILENKMGKFLDNRFTRGALVLSMLAGGVGCPGFYKETSFVWDSMPEILQPGGYKDHKIKSGVQKNDEWAGTYVVNMIEMDNGTKIFILDARKLGGRVFEDYPDRFLDEDLYVRKAKRNGDYGLIVTYTPK